MKTILFPTDFSPAAEAAFIYALKVADRLDTGITTLHVYQLPDIRGVQLPRTLQEIYDSIDLEEFDNFKDTVPRLRQIAEENGMLHIPVKHVMHQGETIPSILRFAEELEPGMIIMGTKGATGLREIFFGSVAAEIMENACCPVLAVPFEAEFQGGFKRIAMTTAFSEEEKEALSWLLDFAGLFGAEIWVVNVNTLQTGYSREQMEALQTALSGIPGLFFKELEGDMIEAPLSRFLEEKNMDLLVMLTHRRNFLQELFQFSQTKQMAYHSKVPVLTIQSHTLEKLRKPAA